MLWLRGLIFTALVPAVVGFVLPSAVAPGARFAGGIWHVGWVLVVAGTLIYVLCLIRFLIAGGTPAIFFTRHIRFLIGEEPDGLVSTGLYRFSRNPMYVGVLLVIIGQAILYASRPILLYGCVAFVFFHLIVVLVEEPQIGRAHV